MHTPCGDKTLLSVALLKTDRTISLYRQASILECTAYGFVVVELCSMLYLLYFSWIGFALFGWCHLSRQLDCLRIGSVLDGLWYSVLCVRILAYFFHRYLFFHGPLNRIGRTDFPFSSRLLPCLYLTSSCILWKINGGVGAEGNFYL